PARRGRAPGPRGPDGGAGFAEGCREAGVMSLYVLAVSVHVVTAILGLGQIVGTAVLASSARAGAPLAPGTLIALNRLGLGTTCALVLMLLSGARSSTPPAAPFPTPGGSGLRSFCSWR